MNTFNSWRGVATQKTPVRAALNWQVHAACAGQPLHLFFPQGAQQESETDQQVRDLCAKCPVQTECLDYSIAQPEKYGRWGGMNEDERASERRRRMRRNQPSQNKPKKPQPRVLVDATGARRRLQAASAAGRILRTYSHLSGVPETTLSKIRAGVDTRTSKRHVERIAEVYEQVLALEHEVYRVSLRTAAERGWPVPDAWVGVDIDDPDAVPRSVAA